MNEFISNLIDKKIKNCKPEFKQEIISYVLDNYKMDYSESKILKLIKQKYNFPANGKQCINYWISRGYSFDESKVILYEYKKSNPNNKKRISPFSREFYTNKINPLTNEKYTEDEADYARNSIRPIRKEYWIKHGYSEEEAIIKAKESKSNNDRSSKGKKIVKVNNKLSIDYWILRGYSEEEAKNNISKLQVTFSKDKCIEKHGYKKGIKIWEDRQIKWQNTLLSKSAEEIEEINLKKAFYSNLSSLTKEEKHKVLSKRIKQKNIYICETLLELKEYIDSIIEYKPWLLYTSASYIFNLFHKHVYYFIKLKDNDIINFISNTYNFKDDVFFNKNSGKYNSYNLYTKEGFLRSKNEINFYMLCKKFNIKFLYENSYKDSTLKYDFYLVDYNLYIEIAGFMDKEDYVEKMFYKQETFNAIIVDIDNQYKLLESIINGNFDRNDYKIFPSS